MAQMFGATVDAIRLHGGWNNSALNESYLREIPRESMMACAGFPPRNDVYFIERNGLQPSDELEKMVFPFLERLMEQGPYTQTSHNNFVDMLRSFRKVLIQYLSILFELFEEVRHPIASCPLVMSPLFRQFRQELLSYMQTAQTPTELQIERVQPLVAGQLASLNNTITVHNTRIESMMIMMMASNQSLNSFMRRIESGIRGFLHADVPRNNNASTNSSLPEEGPINADILLADSEPAPEAPEPETATFEMSRALTTVVEAHNEWFYGINGGMSVVQADKTLGTSWRRAARDRKH
jgi:hypothetical protein